MASSGLSGLDGLCFCSHFLAIRVFVRLDRCKSWASRELFLFASSGYQSESSVGGDRASVHEVYSGTVPRDQNAVVHSNKARPLGGRVIKISRHRFWSVHLTVRFLPI
jgi:hypothetical protein